MKEHEYKATQALLISLSLTASSGLWNLDEFIEAINKAETLGPVLDPSLFMEGSENLQKVKEIAQAARRFRSEIQAPLNHLMESIEPQSNTPTF